MTGTKQYLKTKKEPKIKKLKKGGIDIFGGFALGVVAIVGTLVGGGTAIGIIALTI